jgi:predicted kinase
MKVIIMRGVSGSGKSTYVRENFSGAVVCSSDNYFMEDGEYKFNPGKLDQAHLECYRSFCEALGNKAEVIVVDNTNIRLMEMSPYIMAAKMAGADYHIVKCICDPEVAGERNLHGVPKASILRMQKNMEMVPPFWKKEEVVKN